jgi:hypothetical protein
MLYKICLLQIFVYLFLSPILILSRGNETTNYSFTVALLFTLIFIVSGILQKNIKRKLMPIDNQLLITKKGVIILSIWALLYSALSLKHGLMNRRIGTHEVAALFSGIPTIELAAFRIFELLIPFIIAYLITRNVRCKLSFSEKILTLCLLLALALSGLVFSRSQTFFLLACSAIILQNSLSRRQFTRLLVMSTLIALFAFLSVSMYRVSLDAVDNLSVYFSDEILKRLDGLELISLLIETYGYPLTGVKPSAIASPILSSIPFLSAGIELKANALTTIKSNILAFEFGSMQGDTNSFVIADVYYWGGVIGIMLSAALLGYAAKKVDQSIFLSRGIVMNSLFIALACNIVYMEREFISFIIGTTRDFIIYCLILFVICKDRKVRLSVISDKARFKIIPSGLNQ